MIRFIITLLVLALGIGLFIMAGTVLLPVIGLMLIVWFFTVLFCAAGQHPEPVDDIAGEPEEDVPASQAVIDVEAVSVPDEEDAPDGTNK